MKNIIRLFKLFTREGGREKKRERIRITCRNGIMGESRNGMVGLGAGGGGASTRKKPFLLKLVYKVKKF